MSTIDQDIVAKVTAAVTAALGSGNNETLEQIAGDIEGAVGSAIAGPLTVESVLQAAISGQIGDAAAKLFLKQIEPKDVANVAASQYTQKWDTKYKVLATPQLIFDRMSSDVWNGLTHAARSKPAGFLIDQEEWFEPVRREMWVMAHVATFSLLTQLNTDWTSQIKNSDLPS